MGESIESVIEEYRTFLAHAVGRFYGTTTQDRPPMKREDSVSRLITLIERYTDKVVPEREILAYGISEATIEQAIAAGLIIKTEKGLLGLVK